MTKIRLHGAVFLYPGYPQKPPICRHLRGVRTFLELVQCRTRNRRPQGDRNHLAGDDARRHVPVEQHLEFVVDPDRSEEHTSELQSLMRSSYAVFCLKNKILTPKQS